MDGVDLECKHMNLHNHLYHNDYSKKEENCWFAW